MQEFCFGIALHTAQFNLKPKLYRKLIAMSFASFSLSIVVDLFAAKIAGYTFI